MKIKPIFLIVFSFVFFSLNAQNSLFYENAYETINNMLEGRNVLSFKSAVYETENAFYNNKLPITKIDSTINELNIKVNTVCKNYPIAYSETDKDIIQRNSALFKVLKESMPIIVDSNHIIVNYPYTYDFDDMWGQKDWSKMFVSKLLVTGKGNCHSLPYLYKILSEELNIPAYLAFAPNHIYIKTFSKKMGWYNTELTSGTFPVDAWLMASGYISVDAVRNGLYMDTLSTKQSVANCLLDLAQGYQHKFGKDNPDFVLKCCNMCLKYHPTNVNAMLTKAEAQKFYVCIY